MLRIRFPNLEIGRLINVGPETLWEVLTNTSRWAQWGPSITAVECPDRYIRKGVAGRVRTTMGLWIPFVVSEMDDGRSWSWHVFGLPATGHRVDRVSKGVSRLVFQVPLFAAPYAVVCLIALHRIERILKDK